jgi:anaerobic ribonucleoside-triphosphate reductase activating protein
MALDDLMALVSKAFSEYGIEGVTYLGGEPTLQKNLHELSKTIHMVGLGIIMFTGREIKDVSPELLEDVDLVIDGHYDKKLQETKRNLVGSSNQRLIHMTGRYASTDWFTKPRLKRVEVNVGGDAVFFSGDVI